MQTPRTVLVVADLESDAMALTDVLEAGGCEVTTLLGATDLVTRYLEVRPEAVVLDLFTDPRAGADLVAQLSNVGWDGVAVPFFAISDDLNSAHTREAIVAGVRAPVLREKVARQLAGTVTEAVDARREEVRLRRQTTPRVVHLNGDRDPDLAMAN